MNVWIKWPITGGCIQLKGDKTMFAKDEEVTDMDELSHEEAETDSDIDESDDEEADDDIVEETDEPEIDKD